MKPILAICLGLCLLLSGQLAAQYSPYHPNAKPVGQVAPNKVPIYAGLGVVALAGSGLMVAGFTQRTNALDNKSLFTTHADPNDVFYSELGLTRDEFEDSYKKDLKKSNLLIYGGAGIVALGAGILINRLVWINRIERAKANRSGFVPSSSTMPLTVTCSANGAGMGLIYHF